MSIDVSLSLNLVTSKTKAAETLNIPIVNYNWIRYSFMFLVFIKYEDFLVTKTQPKPSSLIYRQNYIFNANKSNIELFYDFKRTKGFLLNLQNKLKKQNSDPKLLGETQDKDEDESLFNEEFENEDDDIMEKSEEEKDSNNEEGIEYE